LCAEKREYLYAWEPLRLKDKGLPNLKVIVIPVLATILHTAPLKNKKTKTFYPFDFIGTIKILL